MASRTSARNGMILPIIIVAACLLCLFGLVVAGVQVVRGAEVPSQAAPEAGSAETAQTGQFEAASEDSLAREAADTELAKDPDATDIADSSATMGTAQVSTQAISQRVDPVWVQEVAQATGIPVRALAAYAGADAVARAEMDCAVGWNTLAAIGYVETHHGTLNGGSIEPDGVARPEIFGVALDGSSTALIRDTDGGLLDGDSDFDRAVGPLQFIPQTWEQWGRDGSGDGAADPHQIDDAALTAVHYLCHAQGSLDSSGAWIAAVRSYNDSVEYQAQVARVAGQYASAAG